MMTIGIPTLKTRIKLSNIMAILRVIVFVNPDIMKLVRENVRYVITLVLRAFREVQIVAKVVLLRELVLIINASVQAVINFSTRILSIKINF
jgi:hypothetical protein